MIFPVESQSSIRTESKLPHGTRMGPVRLAVTEREDALDIWRDVVGLELLADNDGALTLGVDATPLIVLETGARSKVVPRTTGLYHVAIHVPARKDLAQFAVRALQRGVRIAPTDHLVSEAIYLWDLDGNGIEITFETPWRGTLGDPEAGAYATTAEGKPHSGREPIDMDDLLGELGPTPSIDARMPRGTRIGHVHVHVNDLRKAMRFYRDGLGFAGLFIIRSFGMGDVGLGYMPHAVAFNVWAGPDAKPAPAGAAGLRWFNVVVPDEAALRAVETRLTSLGFAFSKVPGGIEAQDPSANVVRVVVD